MFIARIVSTKNTLHSFTIVVGFFPQKHQQFLRRMIYKRLKSKLCIKKKKRERCNWRVIMHFKNNFGCVVQSSSL